eukprot:CAMPEP_0117020502 /NCGR_PEP_ID=MMETSP0472-20121206/15581_1 /TAXON_ID=693140 ORGANISM="Tiarina fusus, Strain LIS" /NCGR_SAMPLE_ID=MMETSP0472 /ASSEMBLY_ACC=CAM_ASM_000603 /LENGTH=89 /DNA_ID=CAMNT_0004725733 /DNA_START=306 /DNA_END=572 /DNA_ORIENTATION=-
MHCVQAPSDNFFNHPRFIQERDPLPPVRDCKNDATNEEDSNDVEGEQLIAKLGGECPISAGEKGVPPAFAPLAPPLIPMGLEAAGRKLC